MIEQQQAPRSFRPIALVGLVVLLAVTCGALAVAATGPHPGLPPAEDVPAAAGDLPVVVFSSSPGSSSSPSTAPSGSPSPGAQPAGAAASSPGAPSAGGSPSKPAASCVCSKDAFGPGLYLVGQDIAAGTWSTGGAINLNLAPCTYRINGGAPVTTTVGVGRTKVTLHSGQTFETNGCTWSWSS